MTHQFKLLSLTALRMSSVRWISCCLLGISCSADGSSESGMKEDEVRGGRKGGVRRGGEDGRRGEEG